MPSPSLKRAPRAAASDLVRAEWLRRVHAEYRSAAITQHLTLWLIQLGVSPDLIHDGLRIVKDELAHARMSHATYRAAGGKEMPVLAQETLGLRRNPSEPLHLAAARAGVEVFCLGETVAVPLFKVLREGCTVAAARRTLDRVLRDEVRHRDFGWSLLDHFLELPFADDVRRLVEAELPAMFGRLTWSYAPPGAGKKDTIAAEDRAWGLMPPARYGQIMERALERDYAPRFSARGFDAVRAFEAAEGSRAGV